MGSVYMLLLLSVVLKSVFCRKLYVVYIIFKICIGFMFCISIFCIYCNGFIYWVNIVYMSVVGFVCVVIYGDFSDLFCVGIKGWKYDVGVGFVGLYMVVSNIVISWVNGV